MDAAANVNTACAPSWPILSKLDAMLLEHDWERIWSMQIGTAPEISVKIRIGDWLHSNKVMADICGRRYAIDKLPNWSIERAPFVAANARQKCATSPES